MARWATNIRRAAHRIIATASRKHHQHQHGAGIVASSSRRQARNRAAASSGGAHVGGMNKIIKHRGKTAAARKTRISA